MYSLRTFALMLLLLAPLAVSHASEKPDLSEITMDVIEKNDISAITNEIELPHQADSVHHKDEKDDHKSSVYDNKDEFKESSKETKEESQEESKESSDDTRDESRDSSYESRDESKDDSYHYQRD